MLQKSQRAIKINPNVGQTSRLTTIVGATPCGCPEQFVGQTSRLTTSVGAGSKPALVIGRVLNPPFQAHTVGACARTPSSGKASPCPLGMLYQTIAPGHTIPCTIVGAQLSEANCAHLYWGLATKKPLLNHYIELTAGFTPLASCFLNL